MKIHKKNLLFLFIENDLRGGENLEKKKVTKKEEKNRFCILTHTLSFFSFLPIESLFSY